MFMPLKATVLYKMTACMSASLARKMCVRHSHSRYILDDGMFTSGCYCYYARRPHDVVWRHGLSRNLQELLKSKDAFFLCRHVFVSCWFYVNSTSKNFNGQFAAHFSIDL